LAFSIGSKVTLRGTTEKAGSSAPTSRGGAVKSFSCVSVYFNRDYPYKTQGAHENDVAAHG